jgi:hypothetical protein
MDLLVHFFWMVVFCFAIQAHFHRQASLAGSDCKKSLMTKPQGKMSGSHLFFVARMSFFNVFLSSKFLQSYAEAILSRGSRSEAMRAKFFHDNLQGRRCKHIVCAIDIKLAQYAPDRCLVNLLQHEMSCQINTGFFHI